MRHPRQQTQSIVGASLLAKTECQSTSVLTDRPLSRAGSLPQVLHRPPASIHTKTCGSKACPR
ncbi:hypothetical protein DKY63_06875 [Pseudomonas putida]|uniref:Uncharacterized protein n=1 Tax=Pseudomonas putida TaxID=303 RepID=A0A2Z4RES8_PSEPU|nr:hypothetical protein DKY63_06875 [Pseudomonas putida]